MAAYVHAACNIGQVSVFQQPMPPSPEGEWWARSWGIIGLSIISGYIVALDGGLATKEEEPA